MRERKDDISLLVKHFALKYGTKMGKKIDSIPQATLDSLMVYPWPGNVRELQNVIERAVILSEKHELKLREWPPAVLSEQSSQPLALAVMERQHILKVLSLSNNQVSGDKGAAKILGMKPTTLESKMKKLGIKRRV